MKKKGKKKRTTELWPFSESSKYHPLFTYHYLGERKKGNRRITTCLLVDDTGEVVAKGVSFCARMDQPCTRTGRQFAFSRAVGALTYLAQEDMNRVLNEDHKLIHETNSPVRRNSMMVMMEDLQIWDKRPILHKVIFRPMYFTDNEKFVLERYRQKLKEGKVEQKKRVGKGEGAKGSPEESGGVSDKYRIQRLVSDAASPERETA